MGAGKNKEFTVDEELNHIFILFWKFDSIYIRFCMNGEIR